MNIIGTEGEVNIENTKKMVDSILNVGSWPVFVVDKSSFEILYQNKKAFDIVGNKIGCFCYELFYTSETPCIDCPMSMIGTNSIVLKKNSELFEKENKKMYSNITWFDGRQAVMISLLNDEMELCSNENTIEGANLNQNNNELDSLTEIPNYLKFYSKAEHDIQTNPNKEFAVVVFDIDRLKSINDLYGLTKGDDALKYVANCLKDEFGSENNYARLHSDMFAFYITFEKKGDIIKQIEKIRKRISASEFEFTINTSAGIYIVNDRSVPVNLMCDRAMMASRTIKDDVMKFCSFYDEQYRNEMLKTSEIEKDMKKALENGEFQMYLQPKYLLENNTLCGAEVLARWIHPTKGIISPIDFIPLFEKNGFILKLDEYMWEEACKTLRRWIDEGRTPIPLSVNISRYHIQHNDLENVLQEMLKKYDLSPKYLNLEITESLFLDKPEELNRVLVKLQSIGFKLEVDDFGSGFSSLNLIRNVSVDTIKIDKEFLDNEIASEKGKIVVNHTIDMAKDLKLQVVAEGVETREHVEFLRSSHCDIAQGFFFAKPMPITEFDKFDF